MQSKTLAWCAMILVVALIVILFVMHTPWWGFIAIFFAFLGVFSHLASIYIRRMNAASSNMLETIAFVCILLAVAGIIVEYIVANWILNL